MAGGRDFVLEGTTPKHGGFLKVDEVAYKVRRFDGLLSETQRREVMRRGDAAATLMYDRDSAHVVLVEQFRIATVSTDAPGEGWLLELPAGVVETGETPRECAAREVQEETGYALVAGSSPQDRLEGLERFRHIATILPSPGGSTERIYIYFVEVSGSEDPKTSITEGGEVRVVPLPATELLRMLDDARLLDAKLSVAAHWLKANPPASKPAPIKPATDLPTRYVWHEDVGKPSGERRIIGIKTGNIADVRGVDIWINSENTDMLMDRFFGRSISATIRYEGAAKYRDGTIYRDTIAEALRRRLGGQIFVRPATVVVTEAGDLGRKPHRVRYIFHAAAVQAQKGGDLKGDPSVSAACLRNALTQGEALNTGFRRIVGLNRLWRWKPLRSILVPLLGAGQGNVRPEEVASSMLEAAIEFFNRDPDAKLREIYFLAFAAKDHQLLADVIGKRVDKLVRVTTETT